MTENEHWEQEAPEREKEPVQEAPPGDVAENAAEATGNEANLQEAEISELKNRLLRLQADYDNFRRRSREDMQQLSIFVSVELLSKFLPVLDNFKRAIASGAGQDAESLQKGIDLIFRQFEKAMRDAGVEEVTALGVQFDPNLHEAVMRCENADLPDGQIDMVLEEGYKLKDKVIRHSKVRVVNNSN